MHDGWTMRHHRKQNRMEEILSVHFNFVLRFQYIGCLHPRPHIAEERIKGASRRLHRHVVAGYLAFPDGHLYHHDEGEVSGGVWYFLLVRLDECFVFGCGFCYSSYETF